MTHRPVSTGRLGDQTNPVRPLRWRVVDASSGRLPGKLQAADKKEEQHLAFSERGRRVRTQCPFWCKQFCSAFHKIFFCYPSKIPCHYRHDFFIQNKISIYMILSFLTMYRSAKKSSFIAFTASRFPHPTLVVCSWLSERRVCRLGAPLTTFTWSRQQRPQKSDQICSLFSNMAQFPGRVKILKQ